MGALTLAERNELKKAGFIPYEVKVFDEAKAPDGTPQELNTKAENWRKMIASRVKWIALLYKNGWNSIQIEQRIMMLYKDSRTKKTPFLLLQSEQSPSAKNGRLTDSYDLRRRMSRVKVIRTLGGAYGRDFRPTTLPKHIPKPTPLPEPKDL
jgi:hypothetical protein